MYSDGELTRLVPSQRCMLLTLHEKVNLTTSIGINSCCVGNISVNSESSNALVVSSPLYVGLQDVTGHDNSTMLMVSVLNVIQCYPYSK